MMSDRKRRRVPALAAAGVCGLILFAVLSRDVGQTVAPEQVTHDAPDTEITAAMPDADVPSAVSGLPDAVAQPVVPAETTVIAGNEQSVVIADVLTDDADDQNAEADLARQEREYLKEALPGNLVVPAEKTAAEVDALFAEFEEYQALAARMEDGTAAAEERSRYYEIRMTKFQEEIALINMCNDVAASQFSAPLCANVAANSAERLAEIEKSMQALEQGL